MSFIHGNIFFAFNNDLEVEFMAEGFGFDSGASLSPDEKLLAFWIYGSDINLYNIKSGETEMISNPKAHHPPKSFEFLSNREIIASFGNKMEIFDIETGEITMTLDTGERFDIDDFVFTKDGQKIITGTNKKIMVWDRKTGERLQTTEVAERIRSIAEARDGQHLIDYPYFFGDEGVRVIHLASGKCIASFTGTGFFETPDGGLAIRHHDRIEFLNENQPVNDKITEHIIRGNQEISVDERFAFTEKRWQNQQGIAWAEFNNLEATRLREKKQFKSGEERLYFDIPFGGFDVLKKLVIQIATEQKIPLNFKFLDVSSGTSKVREEAATRFVLNFASLKQAKTFYKRLSEMPDYQNIEPDRETEYYAYNIDGKAHYTQGYREIREDMALNQEKQLGAYQKNSNGTYTIETVEGLQTISQEEYEELRSGGDFHTKFKKRWDSVEI